MFTKQRIKKTAGFIATKDSGILECDPLSIPYVLMTSPMFHLPELSFFNPTPKKVVSEKVIPEDGFLDVPVTEKDLASFEAFIECVENAKSAGIHCVCALDENDEERVCFVYLPHESIGLSVHIFGNPNAHARAHRIFKRIIQKAKAVPCV